MNENKMSGLAQTERFELINLVGVDAYNVKTNVSRFI